MSRSSFSPSTATFSNYFIRQEGNWPLSYAYHVCLLSSYYYPHSTYYYPHSTTEETEAQKGYTNHITSEVQSEGLEQDMLYSAYLAHLWIATLGGVNLGLISAEVSADFRPALLPQSPWREGRCQGLSAGTNGHGHVLDNLAGIQWQSRRTQSQ